MAFAHQVLFSLLVVLAFYQAQAIIPCGPVTCAGIFEPCVPYQEECYDFPCALCSPGLQCVEDIHGYYSCRSPAQLGEDCANTECNMYEKLTCLQLNTTQLAEVCIGEDVFFPGEKCTLTNPLTPRNGGCYTSRTHGACVNGTCIGGRENHTCVDDECVSPLVCDDRDRCVMPIWPGGSCQTDNERMPCIAGTFCYEGTCILPFSQAVGETCSEEEECNPGLFCSSQEVCTQPTTKYNGKACKSDSACDERGDIICLCNYTSAKAECTPATYTEEYATATLNYVNCLIKWNCSANQGPYPGNCVYMWCNSQYQDYINAILPENCNTSGNRRRTPSREAIKRLITRYNLHRPKQLGF